MAGNFSVATAFVGRDRMSPVFGKMGKSASMFGSILKANLVGAAIQKGFGMVVSSLKTVTGEFIAFEGALTSAGAKFKDINVNTAAGQKQLEQLGMTARQVGATTKFSATEAAEGLDFLAMAGFSATESMIALPQVTNLAVVAQTDLARATDIASDSLGAFGLDVTQLTRVNDVFAKTMTTSNTNMEDMFEAIKKGAPTFTAAGQTLETFNTLLGTMANSGVKGSEAGTSLRNIMLRLSKPTNEAASIMKNMGIVTQDSKGNFLDVIDILGQFEQATAKMGTQQKTAALSTIFGARAVTGINLLLQEGSANLRDYREQLIGAGGASAQMAGTIQNSLGNRLASLRSALIETGFTFVSVFQQKAGATIDKLIGIVRKIDLSSLAIQIDNLINKAIESFPLIKEKFLEVLPAIKQTASDLGTIVKSIAGLIARITGFTAGPMGKLIKFVTVDINPFVQMLKLLNRSTGLIASFLGGGDKEEEKEAVEAPNRREAEARQQIAFQGRLDIAGAPEGSQLQTTTTGAPPIRAHMLGAAQ